MKLYATVTSERATKGQGGNREIVVNLKIDPVTRKEIGNLVMRCEDNTYTVCYYPINENCTEQKINSGRILLYQTKKGEKQKGALCGFCYTQKANVGDTLCEKCARKHAQ